MKREGPCCHCGIAYTPLWRSGPAEKPVLCNACGSRWRIRGTLADYAPKHATKDNHGRKTSNGTEGTEPDYSSVRFEDETANRSSAGSSASSETCVHAEKVNGLDGFKIWDRESIPRRKRSVLNQWVLSPMERLHKDLLQLMYQQEAFEQPADEGELIYENTNIFASPPETAYGAMLLPPPNAETKENQGEAPGTEKETKPEAPLTEVEIKSESPITEVDIKLEITCTEKKTSCSTDIPVEQLSPKSIRPTNQVAEKDKRPPYVRKRGRPRKGTKHSTGHKCTSSREESANGMKDVYVRLLPTSEVRAFSPAERSRGCQLQYNQTFEDSKTEGNQLSNLEHGGCIEEEAELLDIPLLSALDLSSEIMFMSSIIHQG